MHVYLKYFVRRTPYVLRTWPDHPSHYLRVPPLLPNSKDPSAKTQIRRKSPDATVRRKSDVIGGAPGV